MTQGQGWVLQLEGDGRSGLSASPRVKQPVPGIRGRGTTSGRRSLTDITTGDGLRADGQGGLRRTLCRCRAHTAPGIQHTAS